VDDRKVKKTSYSVHDKLNRRIQVYLDKNGIEWVKGDADAFVFIDDEGNQTVIEAATLDDAHAILADRNSGAHATDRGFIDPTSLISPRAPAVGETLIGLFCERNMREAILGDLAEKFETRAAEHGEKNARAWYWWHVARSCGPFAWRWARRLVALDDLRQLIGW
jgi:hypothetical protein